MTFPPSLYHRFWRSFRYVFLLIICFHWHLPQIAGDCAPAGTKFEGYSFLQPNLLGVESQLAPYFLGFSGLYDRYFATKDSVKMVDNLTEWRERFCNKATLRDMQFLIYESTVGELEELRDVLRLEESGLRYLGTRLSRNSFVRHLDRHKCQEVVEYLIFAKRCEPQVTLPPNLDRRNRDHVLMRNLIEEGQNRFLRTESHYVKLRYAYQIIRLAHYLKDYKLTLELYDFLMPKIDNDPSLIEYWILGHRAGALRGLGRHVEASYYYSRIFEKCPSKRTSAYRSFLIKSDEEWQACLLYCKNDHERATLYVLRAHAEDARLVEEMQSVYIYDPSHPALELLLIREMAKLEKDLLGLEFNQKKASNRQYFNIPRRVAGQRVIDMQGFVRKALEDGHMSRPVLWKIAEGYLELLAGDYYFAVNTFEEAEQMLTRKQKGLAEQLQIFQLVLEIIQLKETNDSNERRIARIRGGNELYATYRDFPKLMRDKMIELYGTNQDIGKAFLLEYSLTELKGNPQLDIIDSLLVLTEKETPNRLERQFIESAGGDQLKNDLLDMKATVFLARQQPEAALEALKEMPRSNWDNYGQFNPFVDRFNDCVNCRLPDSVILYNKGEMVEEILELEYNARAETDFNRAAILYYRLGTAFYNLSYFGNSWRAGDYFRSSTSISKARKNPGENIFGHPQFPFGNRENFDVSRAQAFFDLAIKTARNPEIAVRAAYAAAKCERNDNYANRSAVQGRTYKYFDLIVKDYAETDFYQRVIEECRTFSAYASQ